MRRRRRGGFRFLEPLAALAAAALVLRLGLGALESWGMTRGGAGAVLQSPAATGALRRVLRTALPVLEVAGPGGGAGPLPVSAAPAGRTPWLDRMTAFLAAVRPGDPRSLLEAQVPVFRLTPRAPGDPPKVGPAPPPAPGGDPGGGTQGGAGAPAGAGSEEAFAGTAGGVPADGSSAGDPGSDTARLEALRQAGPVVAVYHTHATEAFIPELITAFKMRGGLRAEQAFVENPELTIVQAGARIARRLEEPYGLTVLHTPEMFDREGRSGSYGRSRPVVQRWLAEHPSLVLLYDVHRDAAPRKQTTLEHEGQTYARLAVVIGQGRTGYEQPNWKQNWAVAKRLISALESVVPGISRGIVFKDLRYNQDLHPGLLLLEIGGVENSMAEVLRTADLIAEATARLLIEGDLPTASAGALTGPGARDEGGSGGSGEPEGAGGP